MATITQPMQQSSRCPGCAQAARAAAAVRLASHASTAVSAPNAARASRCTAGGGGPSRTAASCCFCCSRVRGEGAASTAAAAMASVTWLARRRCRDSTAGCRPTGTPAAMDELTEATREWRRAWWVKEEGREASGSAASCVAACGEGLEYSAAGRVGQERAGM